MNYGRDWSNVDGLFGDRRRQERRNIGEGYPAHLSFSRCRRSDDRRSSAQAPRRDWWLNTNYLDWEAGFHRINKQRKPEA